MLAHRQELLVTPELLEAGRNGRGESVFEMDEAAQLDRWHEVKFRRGPWPEGRGRHEPGSLAWMEAREARRLDVDRRPAPGERAAPSSRRRAR
ncbi:hypothetical protein O2W15_07540 [Modestobacter sp. VKM Ac-2979]|uniref:hypothetical protein n=1 Tax=unclassified Modestobacter TaxID=2643866 RepID=UPI0022AB5430|nr:MULTISPECIES: hypothetical protein [unclassified Modestobacter]MCZ2811290.1 hypothetical protein [Modestobacter sp. VKM Ac-2979]MCZ2840803.1 hypothetical protein [Modestobacter sp. VKM Ac-2980]